MDPEGVPHASKQYVLLHDLPSRDGSPVISKIAHVPLQIVFEMDESNRSWAIMDLCEQDKLRLAKDVINIDVEMDDHEADRKKPLDEEDVLVGELKFGQDDVKMVCMVEMKPAEKKKKTLDEEDDERNESVSDDDGGSNAEDDETDEVVVMPRRGAKRARCVID